MMGACGILANWQLEELVVTEGVSLPAVGADRGLQVTLLVHEGGEPELKHVACSP